MNWCRWIGKKRKWKKWRRKNLTRERKFWDAFKWSKQPWCRLQLLMMWPKQVSTFLFLFFKLKIHQVESTVVDCAHLTLLAAAARQMCIVVFTATARWRLKSLKLPTRSTSQSWRRYFVWNATRTLSPCMDLSETRTLTRFATDRLW